MLTFNEALTKSQAQPRRNILLGNGFSQAWNTKIFSYANLLTIANFGKRDDSVRELFSRLDTFDFESVMRALLSSRIVLETYGADKELIDAIVADQNSLKDSLLVAIAKSHPNLPS